MENNPKPATQGVGVSGFNAERYPSDVKNIPWHELVHLPKFQMYAVEKTGSSYGTSGNVMEWISGYVQDRLQTYGEENLFEDYVAWHNQKGYWNKEDVFGNLLNSGE